MSDVTIQEMKAAGWATEELQQEILDALKSKRKKDTTADRKEHAAKTESAKQFGKVSETVKQANRRVDEFGKGTAKVVESLGEMESSASSVVKSLGTILPTAGLFGTALGLAAGVIDGFIDAQTAAIQSGFSFSEAMVSTRGELASIGLNFTQLSAIIAENGEAIRNLGSTGAESAVQFTDLVHAARDATKSMGYYGLSSEEIANEMADLTGTLVKAGVPAEELFSTAASSFSSLNREVLGYARLTGMQRREIMRNRSAVDADSLFLSTISELGPNALAVAQSMTDQLTATFGTAAPGMIEAVKGMVVTAETGVQQLSNETLRGLKSTGMYDQLMAVAQALMNPDDMEGAMKNIQGTVFGMAHYMQDNEEMLRQRTVQFGKVGGESADVVANMLEGAVNSRTLAANTKDAASAQVTMYEALDDSTQSLLTFKQELDVVIQTLRASMLALFGIEDLSDLPDLDLPGLASQIHDIASAVGNIFGGENQGLLIGGMLAGIAALWTAPAVVAALAMRLASDGLGLGGKIGGKVKGGAKGLGGMLKGMLTKENLKGAVKGGSKKLPLIGSLLSAGSGMLDSQYKDAGYGMLDRGGLGLVESLADLGDFAANIGTFAVGKGWNNDIDMSQAFKDWATKDSVADVLAPFRPKNDDAQEANANVQSRAAQTTTPNYEEATASGGSAGRRQRRQRESEIDTSEMENLLRKVIRAIEDNS